MSEKDIQKCPRCGSLKTRSANELDRDEEMIFHAKLGIREIGRKDRKLYRYCPSCGNIFRPPHSAEV